MLIRDKAIRNIPFELSVFLFRSNEVSRDRVSSWKSPLLSIRSLLVEDDFLEFLLLLPPLLPSFVLPPSFGGGLLSGMFSTIESVRTSDSSSSPELVSHIIFQRYDPMNNSAVSSFIATGDKDWSTVSSSMIKSQKLTCELFVSSNSKSTNPSSASWKFVGEFSVSIGSSLSCTSNGMHWLPSELHSFGLAGQYTPGDTSVTQYLHDVSRHLRSSIDEWHSENSISCPSSKHNRNASSADTAVIDSRKIIGRRVRINIRLSIIIEP